MGSGAWTYLLVGDARLPGDGCVRRAGWPGEFTVLLGGAVAAQGEHPSPVIIAVTWTSAFAGDSVSFMLGARLGRGFLVQHGRRVRISEIASKQVESVFLAVRRDGRSSSAASSVWSGPRAIHRRKQPLPYRTFAPFSILGTGLWSIGLILLSYFFAQSLDTVTKLRREGAVRLCDCRRTRCGDRRDLQVPTRARESAAGSRPRWRSVGPFVPFWTWAAARPAVRSSQTRLTPGRRIRSRVHVAGRRALGRAVRADLVLVGGRRGPGADPGDQTACNVAQDLETTWLVDVAKVVTWLGSGWMVYPLGSHRGDRTGCTGGLDGVSGRSSSAWR